jgi:hypothetical protein
LATDTICHTLHRVDLAGVNSWLAAGNVNRDHVHRVSDLYVERPEKIGRCVENSKARKQMVEACVREGVRILRRTNDMVDASIQKY